MCKRKSIILKLWNSVEQKLLSVTLVSNGVHFEYSCLRNNKTSKKTNKKKFRDLRDAGSSWVSWTWKACAMQMMHWRNRMHFFSFYIQYSSLYKQKLPNPVSSVWKSQLFKHKNVLLWNANCFYMSSRQRLVYPVLISSDVCQFYEAFPLPLANQENPRLHP